MATVKTKLNIDKDVLKDVKLVAVAYSFVDKNLFPNEEAYKAEKEVEDPGKCWRRSESLVWKLKDIQGINIY